MKYNLTISGKMHELLKSHLYPGDGNEAVALAICGRTLFKGQERLLVHQIFPVAYEDCAIRKPNLVKWSTKKMIPIIEQAAKKGMAILKIHSHPTDYPEFSSLDDTSDCELFDGVFGSMSDQRVHASAIMLPGGKMFGRIITAELEFKAIDRISVIGNDLFFWDKTADNSTIPEFSTRTAQTFGEGTTKILKNLKIAVIGCSGTGGPIIEQLVRLGVGKIVLVDDDIVKKVNLNRIPNTTIKDALAEKKKVHALKEAIEAIGLGTVVVALDKNLYDDIEIIKEIASCDVQFGCTDTVDGRHLLNQIASFYLLPYFDLGVKIIADGHGGIDQICGAIHYLQPGGSSLLTREVYSPEKLRAAIQFRVNPSEYDHQKRKGYMTSVNVESPAVISINTLIASYAVNDFLSRIHPYRFDKNEEYAITRIDVSGWSVMKDIDGKPDSHLVKFVGRGDCVPLLNMPELSVSNDEKIQLVDQNNG